MISTVYQKHTVKISTIWLYNQEIDTLPQADLIECIQAKEYAPEGVPFLSLTSNLTETANELFSRIDKKTRYEIRRADKESISYQCSGFDGAITDTALKAFFACYAAFAKAKQLRPIDESQIMRLARQKLLLLSSVEFGGKPIVFHTYVFDDTRSRLLHSVSAYRTDKEINPVMVGRLNRWLHWKDMCFQKEKGIQSMDWGGISYENPEIENITNFKKQFGGVEWKGYSYVRCCTLKGKLYEACIGMIKHIRK